MRGLGRERYLSQTIMTPKEYFEKLPESLKGKGDKITSINAIYQFDIKGPSGGTWTVDLTTPGGKVSEGASANPNCTVTMEDENFVKLVSGQLNPQMAFMTGKLKVTGNMGLALKLATII
jgi:SCP-2 sterol transfer family protein